MPEEMFKQAVSLHKQGKLEEAGRLYLQILKDSGPADFEAQYLLAFLRYQQGNNTEALRAVETALAREPAAAKALLLHGMLLQATGKPAEALAQLDAAAARDPGNVEIWRGRGRILAGLDRKEEAVASFDRALTIRPTADCWNDRGTALQSLKRWQEALQSFDAALALEPDYALLWTNRGIVLQYLERFEDALAACDRALSLASTSVEAWDTRGCALFKMTRFEEALASHDKAVALRPERASGWGNRGIALLRLKRHEEAITSYDKALNLAPDYVQAMVHRATALIGLHRLDEAVTDLEEALRIQPDNPDALFARAKLLYEQEQTAEAHRVLKRRADRLYASQAVCAGDDPPHKRLHDAEQRDYLARQGISADIGIHFEGGDCLPGPAVNALNRATAETAWRRKRPAIVVIDNFLTPDAVKGLRCFCWGSTVWRRIYQSGYLGAMEETGFACPLLAQIADELRGTLPGVLGAHKLTMMWGFKYDSGLNGTEIHADEAAVNVNFWITPDEANRNPENGGLLIWDAYAPLEWDFTKYNSNVAAARAFLASLGAKPFRVPYRANRAVIFDSNLFHETDKIEFEEGYLNRRINITMLYGKRTSPNGSHI